MIINFIIEKDKISLISLTFSTISHFFLLSCNTARITAAETQPRPPPDLIAAGSDRSLQWRCSGYHLSLLFSRESNGLSPFSKHTNGSHGDCHQANGRWTLPPSFLHTRQQPMTFPSLLRGGTASAHGGNILRLSNGSQPARQRAKTSSNGAKHSTGAILVPVAERGTATMANEPSSDDEHEQATFTCELLPFLVTQ